MQQERCLRRIDHKYTRNLVCPWCGAEDLDSWMYEPGKEDLGIVECIRCERPFDAERIITVQYSTKKVTLGTCQKCGEENVALRSVHDTVFHYDKLCEECASEEFFRQTKLFLEKLRRRIDLRK